MRSGLEALLALSPALVKPPERVLDKSLASADQADAAFRVVSFRVNECAFQLKLSAEFLADFPGSPLLRSSSAWHRPDVPLVLPTN